MLDSLVSAFNAKSLDGRNTGQPNNKNGLDSQFLELLSVPNTSYLADSKKNGVIFSPSRPPEQWQIDSQQESNLQSEQLGSQQESKLQSQQLDSQQESKLQSEQLDSQQESKLQSEQPDSQQESLESKLQNSLTLLFSGQVHGKQPDNTETGGDKQQVNLTNNAVTFSTQTQSIGQTSVTEVKITVSWGRLATGYLSQLKTASEVADTQQVRTANSPSLPMQKHILQPSVKAKAEQLQSFKLMQASSYGRALYQQVRGQVSNKSAVEIVKPFFDLRYQPHSEQALYVFSTQQNELKVSARDYFSGQDHSYAIRSWMSQLASDEMLAKIQEYSFNGVTVWRKGGLNGN
ncbi:hypothetical protein PSECIP111951_00321 [Pseudoalteromonas holothuriae]|uniref:Uncharacterized protein n=1 Tax=Pseudoalteromonas holothuriae TaxID=2963714 RepID=A0ABN8UKS2_9GAMM|nr:hypothetical protein [Pseudoalteromonas sp. CIP111951]CAH9051066.1 hypothetical protein PSECIP111951_00321 [Pseudoalteromonas sp. CIP111951]